MAMTLGADSYILVGFWWPLLAMGFLFFWARIVSSYMDKDAQFFHFKRREWNLGHLICGTLGFVVMILPVQEIWWPAVALTGGPLVMFSSTLAYWWYRNRNVPEDKKYSLSTDGFREKLSQRRASKASRAAAINLINAEGGQLIAPDRESDLYETHLAMEDMMSPALLALASTVELAPANNGQYQLSQMVYGVRYRRDAIPAAIGSAIIDYLKQAAGLDTQDKRRPQRGDFGLAFGVETYDLRLRCSGRSAGQTMQLEVNLPKRTNKKFADVGFLPRQVEALEKATSDPHGVILVTAPAKQGRTTAMYALLRRHDAFTNNIRTHELEQLVRIEGVGHAEFKPTADGPDYATQLRSILRRDPSIVMVAEIPDDRTAQEIVFPGPGGPLVYAGMRADSGMEALARWLKATGSFEKAAAPLKAVISVRLARRLCNCKQAYQPSADQLRKLGIPADRVKHLFKPSGRVVDERNREEVCPECSELGYNGQVGLFEVMVFDDEARKLLSKGDLNGLRTLMARQKMMSIQQAGLAKAIEGVTSIEEVIRVTKSSGSGKKAKSS